MKLKIIVVCGPTSAGKSDKAVELAIQHNGEIISADSRQVYKGLDIGSGKITTEEMKGIKHYLLDVADLKEVFTVEDFVTLGEQAIQEILSKGKLPIICGGTGFYIDALVHSSQFPAVPPNPELRSKLEALSLEQLQNELQELDPERFQNIDIQNPVRLVRAIEIASVLGKVPPVYKESKYDIEYVYLDLPDEILEKRIYDRIITRLDTGMIDEVKRLYKEGVSYERMKQLGLEYRYIAMHLLNELTYENMISELNTKTWQYAKRQRKWFKKFIEIK